MKLNYNDPETQSKNISAENIEQLKKLFPNIVEEGKVNFEALRQLLGDEVVEENEYYRFTWPGKHQARQEALKTSTGTLRPAKADSVDWDTTQNLYIEGDNLEVLKLLQRSYFNKVKMIYIDPPYNTGKDFVYKDNYKDNLAEYNEKFNRTDIDGNVLNSDTNSEGNARYHSNWLNMMYPRLQLARNLLKEDGVIFISIDDNEVHNLRRICDEIFGEENFVGQITWHKKTQPSLLSNEISKVTENVLLYKKSSFKLKTKGGETNPDKHIELLNISNQVGKRILNKENILINNGVFTGVLKKNIYGNAKLQIELLKDVFIKEGKPDNDLEMIGRFKWNQETMNSSFDNGDIYHIKSITTLRPTIQRKNKIINIKPILDLLSKKLNQEIPTNTDATNEMKSLFNGISIMDYPKPLKLIKYLINSILYDDNNEIILDFFSGSATTAHAVMDLNKEDILEGKKANRKYIMVQLPEPTDEKSEAYKAGYKTLTEIGKERIRRAANQIKEELKDQPEVLSQLDLGFKVFKLDSSNVYEWSTKREDLEANLFQDEVIKQDRTAEDMLYEVLIKYGLDLTYPIEEVELDGKKVYSVGAGQLIFCLEDGVTRDTAKAIIDYAKEEEIIDTKVVFKDAGFTNDVEKTNVVQMLKTYGITDVKSI